MALQEGSLRRIYTTIMIFLTIGISAQNLKEISGSKPITTGGYLSLNQTLYHAKGIENRRDPYFWQFNANFNLKLFELVDLPFSLVLSQQNKQFDQPQPFNRFGISPNYRYVTLHLGHRSLYFSDFTMSGNVFFGTGLEFKPENLPIRATVFYGRFTKPVSRFSEGGITLANPAFLRMGYGAKIGFEKDRQSFFLNFLKSSDDPVSIDKQDSLNIRPQENLVIGIMGSFSVVRNITFDFEYAYSFLTRDITSDQPFIDEYSFNNNLGPLFKPNGTSSFSKAINSTLTFSGNLFQMSFRYRRVDPDFETHGSTFINNDLENLTIGLTIPLWKRKINVSSQIGIQQNNIEQQLSSGLRRLALSTNMAANLTQRLNLSLAYSNFSTSTIQSLLQPDILTDTLEFFQVNGTTSANLNYLIGTNMEHNIFFLATRQSTEDSEGNHTEFLTANLGATLSITKISSASLSGVVSENTISGLSIRNFGPMISYHQQLFRQKIQTTVSFNHLRNYQEGNLLKLVSTLRGMVNYRITEKQTATLLAIYTYQHSENENNSSFTELRLSLNWGWRF